MLSLSRLPLKLILTFRDKITHQKRRYWIDELSDCIDMYCKKYINSDFYVKCMMANCPEGVLITSEKRSRENLQNKLQIQGRQVKASELETTSEISGFYNPGDSEYVQAKDAYNDPETLLLKRLKNKKIYSIN